MSETEVEERVNQSVLFPSSVTVMDASPTTWYWFYKADCDDWHRIEDSLVGSVFSSAELDHFYLQNPDGVLNTTANEMNTRIDFAECMLVNLTTEQTWQIKRSFQAKSCRRCNHDGTLPAHWRWCDPRHPYLAFHVRRDTGEHQEIERFVRDVGLLDKPIISIIRIQNVDLWELFCRKRQQMMRIAGQSDINEQRLFHGTSERNLDSICTHNFNCRLADQRRKGHIHGKGTYFAKFASYAARYSEMNSGGSKVLLLARVIVGKYRAGERFYCTPNDDCDQHVYDSCVDNAFNPHAFVIFDSNQIYPEYVIKFLCR